MPRFPVARSLPPVLLIGVLCVTVGAAEPPSGRLPGPGPGDSNQPSVGDRWAEGPARELLDPVWSLSIQWNGLRVEIPRISELTLARNRFRAPDAGPCPLRALLARNVPKAFFAFGFGLGPGSFPIAVSPRGEIEGYINRAAPMERVGYVASSLLLVDVPGDSATSVEFRTGADPFEHFARPEGLPPNAEITLVWHDPAHDVVVVASDTISVVSSRTGRFPNQLIRGRVTEVDGGADGFLALALRPGLAHSTLSARGLRVEAWWFDYRGRKLRPVPLPSWPPAENPHFLGADRGAYVDLPDENGGQTWHLNLRSGAITPIEPPFSAWVRYFSAGGRFVLSRFSGGPGGGPDSLQLLSLADPLHPARAWCAAADSAQMVVAAAVSADGKRAAYQMWRDGRLTLALLDARGRELARRATPGIAFGLSFLPHGYLFEGDPRFNSIPYTTEVNLYRVGSQ